MQNKTLKILGIIFAALVALILIQGYAPNLLSEKKTEYEEDVSSVSPDSVSSIEISKKDQSVQLSRQDNTWKVLGKRASGDKIKELLDQLVKPEKHELIAQTNQRHKELEVSTDSATIVKIGEDKTLYAGTSSTQGVYIRLEGSDNVYLLSNLSAANLSTDPKDWYDKTIVKISEDTLTKIEVSGKEKFTLVKEENTWKLENNKQEANKEKLQPVLSALSSFMARNLAEQDAIAKYPKTPTLTITVEYKEGKETLEFYTGETESLVKKTSDGEHFVIGDYQAKDFQISQADLLKPAAQPTPGS